MIAEVTPPAVVDGRSIDFGSVYEEHVGLLVGTAVANFRICETDAQTLAHEVFLAFFLKAHDVLNPRAWLLSAMSNASKSYLRSRARHVALTSDYDEMPDPGSKPDSMAIREVLCCLTARCQLALRLRYVEGFSIPEIAVELDTTAKYAQKLVTRCRRQAQQRYAAKEKA